MDRPRIMTVLMGLVLTCAARAGFADIVSPDSSYCVVSFSRTYSGSYHNGQPYDYLTVATNGRGETFAAMGISITATLRNSAGEPLAGVPAYQIVLYNNKLCICTGGSSADTATDFNGQTTFSGTLRAGGCSTSLSLFADGMFICTLPVKINSPDVGASPCFIDSSDLAAFSGSVGYPARYNICFDFNESGIIDASDVAFFASLMGSFCN